MKTPFKFALSAVAATLAFGAFAQDFPAKDRTVTIVVPFAAGGPTDRVARDLAEAPAQAAGRRQRGDRQRRRRRQHHRHGQGARATPDGYTLLLNHIGMATMPALYRKLPFNVVNDFEYLGIVNDVPMTSSAVPRCPPATTRSSPPGSSRTRARSTWATPAWAQHRTCAACCSRAPPRSR